MPYSAAATEQSKKESTVTKALLRAGDLLSMSGKDLGMAIGVSPSTISRLRSHADSPLALNSKAYELSLLVIRLYRSLDAAFGGNDKNALAWFEAENYHLNGIPKELVKTAGGLVGVVNYLDAIRGKL